MDTYVASPSAYAGPLHRSPPFRAEHLGSLLRTERLLETRHALEAETESANSLRKIEDEDIHNIVKTQLDLGFYGITDGEYRRHVFWGSFWPALGGMKELTNPSPDIFRKYIPHTVAFTQPGFSPGATVICTSKIKHVGSTYTDQFDYLKLQVPKDRQGGLKLTLAAPNWYHLQYKEGFAYPKNVYANDDEYFADVAKAYQDELRILYLHGLRNVQFDDPGLAYFCSEAVLDGWAKDTHNTYSAEEMLDKYVKLYNSCISKCPDDMHLGVHICRGNFGSHHFTEGGYDRIATKLFQELNVHTYYLEYDTARSGGFEPLQCLPKNKNIIMGVITSKFPKMEDLGEMETRVREAVKWMCKGTDESEGEALKRVGVSPQCGFASHSSGNAMKTTDMMAKLKLVRSLANKMWPGQP